jgi:hypothetical protein
VLILDFPAVPPTSVRVILSAQTNQPRQGAGKVREIGVCHPVPNYGPLPAVRDMGEYIIEPSGAARDYFWLYEKTKVKAPARVTIIRRPAHGILVDEGAASANGAIVDEDHAFSYRPVPGFIGKDHATILVDIGDYAVKVQYYFQAVNRALGDNWIEELCGKRGYSWKIAPASDVEKL